MTLEGDNTRPTPERVKEAVFSMIQFDLEDANFLDLFAGSGQMGLEALSRGAAKAHMIDRSPEAAAIIRQNAEKTHLSDRASVMTSDAAEYIRSSKGRCKFDFVFRRTRRMIRSPGTMISRQSTRSSRNAATGGFTLPF